MNTSPDIRILKDLEYLGPGREEKLDAYLPPESFPGPHPAIVLIHGGGWRICDKADNREVNIATQLASAGYAVFSINYKLNVGEKDASGTLVLTEIAWPQNFYDCKTAVRYVRANAGEFGVDAGRIATMGGSAGGHLSMLVGCTARHEAFNREGLYTDQSNDISCILNFYGEFDMRDRVARPMAGATPEETEANTVAASPKTWIDEHTPPMFITHGTKDTTISVERSRLLARYLDERDLPYTYVELAGAPHTYHLQPEQLDLFPVVRAFLGQYLGEPPR